MSDTDDRARIEALEIRITQQERTIEDLNTAVTDHWKQIDKLAKQVERMADRLQRVEDGAPSDTPDPPPPHY